MYTHHTYNGDIDFKGGHHDEFSIRLKGKDLLLFYPISSADEVEY